LELNFFSTLELANEVVDFGCQPIEISYNYNDYPRTYYPDFYYLLSNGAFVIGEVKMLYEMGYFYNWSKWKGLKRYCKKNGIGFLITNGKNDIQDLKDIYVNKDFREELLDLFKKFHSIEWETIYDLKLKYDLTMKDIASVVYQEKIKWYRKPARFVKSN